MRSKRQYQISFAVSASLIFVYSLMLAIVPPSQLGAATGPANQTAAPALNEHILHIEGIEASSEDADLSLQ